MQNLKTANEDLGRLSEEEYHQSQKLTVVVVLDNLRSLNNIGSFFRTVDAFRFEAIYLCGVCGTPPHREIHKTALGAEQWVQWKKFNKTNDAIDELKANGYLIYSIEQAEKSIELNKCNFSKDKKYALVFGNEVYGVEQEIIDKSDSVIEIPQSGSKHSLNVAVSGGVVLWEVYKQMSL